MVYVSAKDGGHGVAASAVASDPSHPDAISIPDAELLFTGAFHRAGPDLVLTGHDGHHHIIPGYFSGEEHPALVAPSGARLSGALIDLLAGSPAPGQYAQAQPTAPADAVGKVEKVVGNVTVVRNGVAVALNVGDKVYKSDVIQTGADSSAGIGFPDGTALNLVANTRMALNEYSFDPNAGASNSALFSLVQGGFAFVAGQVAHNGSATGGMKIETPVATMGIRGTTGYALEQVATVTANIGNVSFSFAVMADPGTNNVGAYVLVDQFGNEVAVNQAGIWTTLSYTGPSTPPAVSQQAMTQANFAIEQQLAPALVQILNNLPVSNDLKPSPTAPSTSPGSAPQENLNPNNLPQLLQQNNGNQFALAAPVTTVAGTTVVSGTVTISTPTNTPPPAGSVASTTVAWNSAAGGNWNTALDWSTIAVPGAPDTVSITPVTQPLTVFVDSAEVVGGLSIAAGATLAVVNGAASNGSLAVSGTADIAGLVQVNSTISDPSVTFANDVKVEAGGQIEASGGAAFVFFSGDSVDNFGTIVADTGGTVSFFNTVVTNEAAATIAAHSNGVLSLEAANVTNDLGATIVADTGGIITIGESQITNDGSLVAGTGGTIDVTSSTIAGGTVTIDSTGTLALAGDAELSNGTLGNSGQFTASGAGNTLSHETVTNAAAMEVSGTLTLENGTAITNSAAADTITVDGTLTLADTSSINGGAVTVDANGTLILTGSGAIADTAVVVTGLLEATVSTPTIDAGTLTITGTVEATGGAVLTIAESVSNAGTLAANGGVLDITGPVSGSGSAVVSGLGTLELGGTDAQPVLFEGAGTLQLDNVQLTSGVVPSGTIVPTTFTGMIEGLAVGDVIALSGIAVASAVISGSTLSVIETNGAVLDYQVAAAAGGSLAADTFIPQSVTGGTDLILTASAVGAAPPTVTVQSPVTLNEWASQPLLITDAAPGETLGTVTISGLPSDVTLTDSNNDTLTIANGSITLTPVELTGLALNTTGIDSAAAATLAVTATASLNGNTAVSTPQDIVLDLNPDIVVPPDVDITAATSSAVQLTQFGGTLTNAGTLTVSGTSTFTGGTETGGGTTAALGGVSLFDSANESVTLDNYTLQLSGLNHTNGFANDTINLNNGAQLVIESGATFTDFQDSGLVIGSTGGTAGTLTNDGTYLKIGGGAGSIDVAVTNAAAATIDAQNGTLILSGAVSNSGILETTSGGDLVVQGALSNQGGTVAIQGGTVELGVSNALIVDFSGLGGTLQLDGTVTGGAAVGVDASSTGGAPITITGAGEVTSTGGDAIEAISAGGTITITPSGAVSGAVDGIQAVMSGTGNITITTGPNADITGSGQYGIEAFDHGIGNIAVSTAAGDVITSASSGINAVNEAAAIPAADGSTITVTAYGTIDSGSTDNVSGSAPSGIVAGYFPSGTEAADTSVTGTVLVDNGANITAAAGYGIEAYNWGNGDVTVNDFAGTAVTGAESGILASATSGGTGNVAVNVAANAAITGTSQYGIEALSENTGNISVSTAAGDVITSASSGIEAVNEATAIPAADGSTITVTAYGTIDSGSTDNVSGSAPSGIAAGYFPDGDRTTDSAVFGTVTVDNFADITAAAGDGIEAYSYGNGNVSVTDEAATTIQTTGAQGEYGIEALSTGIGNVSVTTSAGDTVDSNGAGILAEEQATTIPSGADSSVTVTAYGTINSGAEPTNGGNAPAGILAGYNSNGQAESGVDGTVTVNNYANITAVDTTSPTNSAGIDAFNYGSGNVTVNDNYGGNTVASTIIQGAQYGIEANARGDGSGNVAVNVGANATIETAIAANAQDGIYAFSLDTGNISVTTSAGDVISGGANGILAENQAGTILAAANSTITVTAADGTTVTGGIDAGYLPDATRSPDSNVVGGVSIMSDATIQDVGGYGLQAFTFGQGNVVVNTGADSVIDGTGPSNGPADGIAAYANDGGNATIINDGTVTAPTGIALLVETSHGQGQGAVAITNSNDVTGAGTSLNPVVDFEAGTGGATLTNSSTIAPASGSASGLAVADTGGDITINNTGTITGDVALGDATFNNELGGTWNVAGASSFGPTDTIDNAGTINVSGAANFGSPASFAVTNGGTINIESGASWTLAPTSLTNTNGTINVTGDGSALYITGTTTLDGGTLNLGSTVGAGYLWNDDPTNAGAALTLGANLTIDQTGTAAIYSTNATTAIDDSVVSYATINASAAYTFYIQPDFFTNYGQINADASGGTLEIIPTGSFTNYGTVAVSNGESAQIENGFVSSTQPEDVTNEAAGVISVSGVGSSLSITAGSFTNEGLLKATAGGTIDVQIGTIDNTGTGAGGILIDGTSQLVVDTATLRLTGGGDVKLESGSQIVENADNPLLQLVGTGSVLPLDLDNADNTISGAGSIGNGDGLLALTNSGVIDATGVLTIDVATLDNQCGGTLEAVSGGTLILDERDGGSTNDGTIKADGGQITINHSASATNDSLIEALNGGKVIDNVVAGDANHGTIDAGRGGTIAINLTSDNGSGGGNSGTEEATSGGALSFTGGTGNLNGGKIEAIGHHSSVHFSDEEVGNAGTIEAKDHGTVKFYDTFVDNDCGTIAAYGDGSSVQLADTTIAGGTLATHNPAGGNGGVIDVLAVGGDQPNISVFDGSNDHGPLTINGYVQVESGANLALVGTIENCGTIALAGASDTNLVIDGVVCLQGPGAVVLSGSNDTIVGATGDDGCNVLVNSNDISGAGQIGDCFSDLALTNASCGIIDATTCTLTIDTDHAVNNAGTLEASGGTLIVDNNVFGCGTVTIAGGGAADFTAAFNQNVTFSGTDAGTLGLAQCYGGTITGFGMGDTVDLTNIGYSSGEYAVWTQACTADGGNGTLAIYNGATTEASLNLNGIYSPNEFTVTSDGASGTDVTINNDYVSFCNGQINTDGSVTPVIGNAGSTLELTNGSYQAASWFAGQQVSVSGFTASFDYQVPDPGENPGNGLAFILQDASLSALGGLGASIGYGPDAGDNTGGTAISPSAAVGFNLFYNSGDPFVQGTGFATDGNVGTSNTYTSSSPVDFWATGDTIQVVLSYSGSSEILTETLTDTVTGATYTASYDNVDLASILGSNTAYVGFSGGTGGASATQIVSNFTLADPTLSVPSTAATTVENTPVSLSGVSVSELDPGDTVTATFSVADGTLSVGTETGVTESGAGTDALTLTGTAAAIDTALAELSYTPGSNFVGTDTLTLNASDGTITADPQTLSIAVNPSGPTIDTWTNATSDDQWSHGGNWSTGAPPTSGEEALIGSSDNPNIYSNVALDDVSVQNAGEIVIASGAILTLEDGAAIVGGGTGSLTINVGTSLDVEAGPNGPIYGATIDGVYVADYGALDVGNVNSGAILTLDDGTTVAGEGSGTLTINAGNTLDVEAGGGPGSGATFDDVNVIDNGSLDIGDVASGAVLTLESGTTVTGDGSGAITVNAGSTLNIAAVGEDPTLDGVMVTDSGAIDVATTSGFSTVLTLDDGTTITGDGTGTLTIGAHGTLDVEAGSNGPGSGATLDGVTVTDNGTIDVDPTASGAILTLDDGTTITGGGTGTLTIGSDGELDIKYESTGPGATLDGVMVNANGGAIVVDPTASGAILTLDDGTTITGDGTGTLTIDTHGTLDVEAGTTGPGSGATLDGVTVTDNGTIDVDPTASGAILTLDDGTTITGDGTGTLTIGAHGTLDVEAGSSGPGSGATLDGVTVTDNGTIDVDPTASGAILTLDNGTTITGGGTGTLTIGSDGELDIKYGSASAAATLDGVMVNANGGAIVVDPTTVLGAILTLDDGTTITGDGTGTLTIDTHSTLEVEAGTTGPGSGATLDGINVTNDGTIDASGATLTVDAGSAIINNSQMEATNGGILDVDSSVSGSGTVTISGGGTAAFADAFDQNVTFSGAGTLALAQPSSFDSSHSITGFGIGDALDLTNLAYSSGDSVAWSQGTLEILNSSDAVLESFYLSGTGYSSGSFSLAQDNGNSAGTLVVFGDEWTTDSSGNWTDGTWTQGVPGTSTDAVIDYGGANYTVTSFADVTVNSLSTASNVTVDINGGGTFTVGTLNAVGPIEITNGSLSLSDDSTAASVTLTTYSGNSLDVAGTLTITDSLTWTSGAIDGSGVVDIALGASATIANNVVTLNAQMDIDGSLTIDNGAGIGGSGSAVNSGLLVEESAGINVPVTNESTGIIEAESGTSSLYDSLTNYGTIDIASGATLDLTDGGIFALDAGTQVSGTGDLVVEGSATLDVNAPVSLGNLTLLNGTMDVNASASVTNLALSTSGDIVDVESGTLTVTGNVTGNGSLEIGNGATLELQGTSSSAVTFEGATGTLQIDSSGTTSPFSVVGGGAAIPQGDAIYLPNISYDAAADSYSSNTSVIAVGDGQGHNVTIDVVGGVGSNDTFTFSQQGTGTLIEDPEISSTIQGTVSIGGPGNDSFVFPANWGADQGAGGNAQEEASERDLEAHAQTAQEMHALMATDIHAEAGFDFSHHDGVTPPSIAASHLQANLANFAHLH